MSKNGKLDTIASLIDKEDFEGAKTIMEQFIAEHPTDWLKKILISKLMSNPIQPNFDIKRNNGVILTILNLAKDKKIAPIDALLPLQIIGSSKSILEARDIVSKKLASISAFSRTPAQQLYRIAAYIESQHAIAEKEFFSTPLRTMSDALVDSLKTRHGLTKASYVGGLESLSDFLDVVIKFIYWKYNPKKYSSHVLDRTDSPYNDADFEMLIITAAYWKIIAELWENVTFDYCRPEPHKEGVNFLPTDRKLMINKEIGIHREYQQAAEWNSYTQRRAPAILQQYLEMIKKLAAQLKIPNDTSVWILSFNLKDLKALYEHPHSLFTSSFDDERGFIDDRLLNGTYIKVGSSASLTLGSFQKIWRAISILALVLKNAVIEAAHAGATPFDFVPILAYDQLVDTVSAVTGIATVTVQNGLERMIYVEKGSELDLYDRPFFPIDAKTILFLPSVALSCNPARVIQNHLSSQDQGNFFRRRGANFEVKIVSTLKKYSDIKVKHGLKFQEAECPEYDIIMHWGDMVFLVEAKCVNHVSTIRELYNAKDNVDYSVQQLLRRKQFLLSRWSLVRQKAPELNLPTNAYEADKIVCVSVNNTMCFTGLHTQDVLIVDDMCFLLFFGKERFGKKIIMDGGKIVSEENNFVIRLSETPQPDEFVRYLRNPPQVERYSGKIEIQLESLTPIEENMPTFVFPMAKTIHHIDEFTEKP